MAAIHFRGQFTDFFFEDALPAVNRVTKRAYGSKRKMMPLLFEQDTSERSIEQFAGVTGTGLLREISEGDDVQVDNVEQGFDKTFRHVKYGLGVEYTREMFEDDKWRLVKHAAEEMGLSAAETQEIQAASVLNNAFVGGAYAGPDGQPLCSLSHPLKKSGGVQANMLAVAADLSVTSLEAALTEWETTKRDNGHDLSLPTPKLLVAPQNRWNAHQILKGEWRSDTSNHTINAFQYAETGPVEQIMVWSKLTDPDAWFLVAPPGKSGLIWIWRRKTYSAPFRDDRNERAGTALRYRASYGHHTFYGVYGTAGA